MVIFEKCASLFEIWIRTLARKAIEEACSLNTERLQNPKSFEGKVPIPHKFTIFVSGAENSLRLEFKNTTNTEIKSLRVVLSWKKDRDKIISVVRINLSEPCQPGKEFSLSRPVRILSDDIEFIEIKNIS